MVISARNKAVQTKSSNHDKEIHTHPWPELLVEAGTGHHAGKAEDCSRNGHPDLEGRAGEEDRENVTLAADGQEIIILHTIIPMVHTT